MSPVELWRTTSCLGSASSQALGALEAEDLALFTEIIDSDTVGLDDTYPERGHTTLLQTALTLGHHDAVRLLLDRGAAPDRYNSVLKVSPLHVALGPSSRAAYQTVELLVEALGPGALEARDWGGQTPLHLAAQRGEEGLPVLRLLLARGAHPSPCDSRAGHTPLDLAALAGCWKAVEPLAAAGGRATPSTLQLLEKQLPNTVRSLGLARPLEPAVLGGPALAETLHRQLPSCREEPSPAWRELLAGAGPVVLDLATGSHTLVQAAAERGLVEHLGLLLAAGAGPNSSTPSAPASALLLAGEAGNTEVLRLLLKHPDIGLEEVDTDLDQNVLLKVMSRPLQELGLRAAPDYPGCLEVLLTSLEAWRSRERCRILVNLQDKTGNSALHYATQFWPQDTVTRILALGANVGLRNLSGEAAVSNILPSTIENFLDSVCLTSNNRNPTNENFTISFNYSFLAPPLTPPLHPAEDSGECCPLLPCSHHQTKTVGTESRDDKAPMLETDVLLTMARSLDHRIHLKHPVITSFLALKWSRISKWYNVNILFIFGLVGILTGYIFSNYAGHSLNVSSPVCTEDLNSTATLTGAMPFGNDLTLWILLTILLAAMIVRELIQFLVAPIKHLSSFENILEIVLIVLMGVLLFHGDPGCHLSLKRELSAAVLLVSWMELLTMLGRHPSWHWCNIYSTMFFRVLTTFLTFLLWYSLFIIAFGLGFYILLHADIEGGEQKFFDHLGLSLVKTFSMFVGELEFSEVPFQVNPRFSYIFFLIFVFLMVVVLMNLLNGLAVNDTGLIQEEAEIYAAESRVEVIHHLEATIACLHRGSWGFIGRRFTRLASCNLFYSVLPHPSLTVKPNTGLAWRCRCLAMLPCSCPREPGTVLGREVLRAARDRILAKQRKEREESGRKEERRELLQAMETLKDAMKTIGQCETKML